MYFYVWVFGGNGGILIVAVAVVVVVAAVFVSSVVVIQSLPRIPPGHVISCMPYAKCQRMCILS